MALRKTRNYGSITPDERRLSKYNVAVVFLKTNKRNPSKHIDKEKAACLNWIQHNRKLLKAREMKEERVEEFEKLIAQIEKYTRVNQFL